MKKIIWLPAVALFLSLSYYAPAQEVKQKVKKGAKAVGNNTAEAASKATSRVKDQKLKDKVAPNGEDVYVNGHGKYYWVNKKGGKRYINENQLVKKVK
ncbi:hypothetical protein [Polluticoccus soli]|uniref:hypothetical protein n=1 Tax=Polluticoccus soli TaxID=3034150 RepID=UPI0023E27955|nr:hypothetical protein [Flavipsychrobacter sp. JY13-12]